MTKLLILTALILAPTAFAQSAPYALVGHYVGTKCDEAGAQPYAVVDIEQKGDEIDVTENYHPEDPHRALYIPYNEINKGAQDESTTDEGNCLKRFEKVTLSADGRTLRRENRSRLCTEKNWLVSGSSLQLAADQKSLTITEPDVPKCHYTKQ